MLPSALIIADDPASLRTNVCGVPVLLRMVKSLSRATGSVRLLKPQSWPDSLTDPLETADGTPEIGRVVGGDGLASTPSGGGLFVTWRPGVFDHRLCFSVGGIPDSQDKIIRFRRPSDEEPVMWYVGGDRAGELLQRIADGADAATAASDFFAAQSAIDIDPGRAVCEVVSDERSRRLAEERLFRQARKDSDTWLARNFDRKLSIWITRQLVRFPITPNHVTILATIIGLVGAGLLAIGTYAAQLLGSALLVLSAIVDGCDGEVARLKYLESEFGRKLDFFLDNVVNVSAIFTVGFGYYLHAGVPVYLSLSFANATAALASVYPVYWLFFREAKPALEANAEKKVDAYSIGEGIAGRDFVYLIFALAVVGKAHWFAWCALGLWAFLAFMLVLVAMRLWRNRGSAIQSSRRPHSERGVLDNLR